MNKYLVTTDPDDFSNSVIILADTKKHALELCCDYLISQDEYFLGYIYEKGVNGGFPERFWLVTEQERHFFTENEGALMCSTDLFVERVYAYFKNKHKFAEMYISHWFNDVFKIDFPPEMIRFIWLKEVKKYDWCEIKIINLSKIHCISP